MNEITPTDLLNLRGKLDELTEKHKGDISGILDDIIKERKTEEIRLMDSPVNRIIFQALRDEINDGIRQHGDQSNLTIYEWYAVLVEEVGEIANELCALTGKGVFRNTAISQLDLRDNNISKELFQVMAVVWRMLAFIYEASLRADEIRQNRPYGSLTIEKPSKGSCSSQPPSSS